MGKTLVRLALAIVASAAPLAAHAQGRTALSVGYTFVDFTLGDFGALTAEARLQQSALEVDVFAILPLGSASAIPSCVPGELCLERTTPSSLVGAVLSLPVRIGGGLRASAGLGGVRGSGMKGLERRSTIAGAVALDWTARRSAGLTPTIAVRAIGFSSDIAGLRYAVVPTIGLAF
jgi:hypothetical protein